MLGAKEISVFGALPDDTERGALSSEDKLGYFRGVGDGVGCEDDVPITSSGFVAPRVDDNKLPNGAADEDSKGVASNFSTW